MARKRDYAAEYQRRQSNARRLGFDSYYSQRETRRLQKVLDTDRERAELQRKVTHPPRGLGQSEVRQLWRQGKAALVIKDHDRANRIARRLGYRKTPDGEPERIFWYH